MATKRKTSKRNNDKKSGIISTIVGWVLLLSIICNIPFIERWWPVLVGGLAAIFILFIILSAKAKRKAREIGCYDITTDINRIDTFNGRQFELWCASLLRNSGYRNVTVTPSSNDQGVDIIAERNGEKYAFQCKRYSSNLGNTPVQEVFTGAAFYGCNKAIVMTNSFFTLGAIEAATRIGVELWDRNMITNLMREANKRLIDEGKANKKKKAALNGGDQNKWPHNTSSREIDYAYYSTLPSSPAVPGQLYVACNVLGGEAEKYNPYDDWQDDSYMVEIVSPFFPTEKDAEHFKMAITKKYFALAKRNGNVVSAYIHDEYIHDLFDAERCIFILDNFCD